MRAVQRHNTKLFARRTLFSLPSVPYAKTGLPPAISPQALDLHLNKHHQTYVNNANKLVTGTPHESASLEQVTKRRLGFFSSSFARRSSRTRTIRSTWPSCSTTWLRFTTTGSLFLAQRKNCG
jgi:superoxide dismutase